MKSRKCPALNYAENKQNLKPTLQTPEGISEVQSNQSVEDKLSRNRAHNNTA